MAFWYHFAILFEALFILTTLDAGTRVCRFLIQDLLGNVSPALGNTESWTANLLATGLAAAGWGWFLYGGVTDPFGGINSLWALFGIANQMLAGIALVFCCVVMVKMKREKYLWIPLLPTAWLLLCTLTASVQKIFHDDAKIGFLAAARRFSEAAARGELIAPAKSLGEMRRLVFNYHVDAVLCALFIVVVLSTVVFGLRAATAARRSGTSSARESEYVALDSLIAGSRP